jgi:cAMP-dependent protein kinase regulator
MVSALAQCENLIIKLIEENHRLRKRLDVAFAEIDRLRTEETAENKRRKIRATPTSHPFDGESFEEGEMLGTFVPDGRTAAFKKRTPHSLSPLDVRSNAMEVSYPDGYEPKRRRFSVSSESYHPEHFANLSVRLLPKTDEQLQQLTTVVKENVLFKHLEHARVLDVVNAMWEVAFGPEMVVIRQGDDGDNMYVIEEGELDVLYSGEVVSTLGAGKVFGETALMYNCPRTATIRAKTAVKLWAIDRETFRRIIMQESIKRRALYQDFLSKVPLLENLLDYERAKVADALEPVQFHDGDVIIKQGSTDVDGFYIIEDGTVRCTKEPDASPEASTANAPEEHSSPHTEVEAIRLGPGDYFGELALLTNKPRAATVTSVGSTKCLRITKKHFDQVMGPCEQILKRNTQTYASYEHLLRGEKQQRTMSRDHSAMEEDPVASSSTGTRGTSGAEEGARRPSAKSADRQDILAKAILSEEEYVKRLSKIVDGYLVGMMHHNELKISPQDISIIFANVQELHATHVGFLDALRHASSDSMELLRVMRTFVPQLHVYLPFIQCYYSSILVRRKRRSVPSFSSFLKSVRGSDKEDLDALLDLPFRRVNHYAQLILDLVQTSSQEESRESFQLIIKDIKGILAILEDARVRAEQVYAILQNITGEVEFTQNPSRTFVYEGRLAVFNPPPSPAPSSSIAAAAGAAEPSSSAPAQTSASPITAYVYGFLFTDILICATQIDAGQGKPKLAHHHTIPLQHCLYRIHNTHFTLEWDKSDAAKVCLAFGRDQAWEMNIAQVMHQGLQSR